LPRHIAVRTPSPGPESTLAIARYGINYPNVDELRQIVADVGQICRSQDGDDVFLYLEESNIGMK